MKGLSKYSIAFKGLTDGEHSFNFEIGNKFFEQFDNEDVNTGQVEALVLLKKSPTFLSLKLTVNGEVQLTCDRCLEPYMQMVENSSTLIVKFGEEVDDQGDEIITIHHDDHQLNLAHLLYELIILGLPIKHVHPDDDGESTCNPEMLEKLENYIIYEEDEEEEPEIDERWSELKKLLDN